MAKSNKEVYQDALAEILSKLDIEAEYRDFGVSISGSSPNENGWLDCHAVGRDDSNASAGINVGDGPARGRYKDHGGDGTSLSFFYAAVEIGHKFGDVKDAVKHYAKQTGVKLPGGDSDSVEDDLEFLPWSPIQVVNFCKSNPPITFDALERVGAKRARWLKNKVGGVYQYVIALPSWGSALLNGDPRGYVLMASNGRPLKIFKDKKWEDRKKHNVGPSGLLNVFALKNLLKADLIWKVEGITDCLALEAMIPENLRGKHIVVTNTCGGGENVKPEWIRPLVGKHVAVVHDRDKTGENGAAKWASALANKAASIRIVVLPFEFSENHGKDLRDFFNEGKSYDDLLQLYHLAATIRNAEEAPAFVSQDDQILSTIKLDVLGEFENQSIRVFSRRIRKIETIRDIDHLGRAKIIQICGPETKAFIRDKDDDDENKFSIGDIRDAIAGVASQRRITDQNLLGQGVWPVVPGEKLCIVNGNSASILNGKAKLESIESPICDDVVLDLSNGDPWCDLARVSKYVEQCDHEFAEKAINAACDVFGRWCWKHTDDPVIVVGLIMATFIQVFLRWRPQVAVMGPSDSGKTTFFETLSKVFGHLALRGEKPSEAGLRQAVGNDSKAILIDEFEADWHRSKVLELIRTSCRGEASGVLRGTADQKGKKFSLRHICWVAAIEVNLKREPDRNRFVALELAKPPIEMARKLTLPSQAELHDIGLRLLATSVRFCWDSIKLIKQLETSSYGGVPSRVVESYSVPVGMVQASRGKTIDESKDWLLGALRNRKFQEVKTSDEDDLILAITGAIVPLGGGKEFSVSEILFGKQLPGMNDTATAKTALERRGIKMVTPRKSQKPFVFMWPKQVTKMLLKGTDWADQSIGQILKRCPGVHPEYRAKLVGQTQVGLLIPIEIMSIANLGPSDDPDDEWDGGFTEST